jgi:predicted ArsR family transcriptional regulator
VKSAARFLLLPLSAGLVSFSSATRPESGRDQAYVERVDDQQREHIEDLQQLMQEIKITQDPERRKELLRRHEQAIRQSMRRINGGTRDLDRSMEERMQDLQERSEMRQEMLEQMIEHQAQEQQTPQEPDRFGPPSPAPHE